MALTITGEVGFRGKITLFLEVLDWGLVTQSLTEGSEDWGLITQPIISDDNWGLIT